MTQDENQEAVAIREPEQLTAKEVRAQVNLVQEVMKSVMKDRTHYGTIPGCGDKPSLLKPGAEKLASTFRLAINPEITDLSTKDFVRYQIRASITHQITGSFLGAGVGECSSMEEKYCWRNAVCDEEFDDTPEDKKRTKYKSAYGKITKLKQVRTNPADIANTVLKMAKKRALVDGILTVTGASDIFTQDIEDMPEELLGRHEAKPKPEVITNQPASANSMPPMDMDNLSSEPPMASAPQGNIISDKQRKRLYAIAKNAKYTDDQFKQLVSACGYSSSTEIQKKHYEAICDCIEGTPVEQFESTVTYLSKWVKEN